MSRFPVDSMESTINSGHKDEGKDVDLYVGLLLHGDRRRDPLRAIVAVFRVDEADSERGSDGRGRRKGREQEEEGSNDAGEQVGRDHGKRSRDEENMDRRLLERGGAAAMRAQTAHR